MFLLDPERLLARIERRSEKYICAIGAMSRIGDQVNGDSLGSDFLFNRNSRNRSPISGRTSISPLSKASASPLPGSNSMRHKEVSE
mmetsp:Transcript_34422/g.112022  ORF Transcript_34422/g.112022 Transcript_34422/m.112022 type:complete len:86 (+) Transcript_34422:1249-1506(+)